MTFIDPNSLLDNLQKLQDKDTIFNQKSQSQFTPFTTALFGTPATAQTTTSDESTTSESLTAPIYNKANSADSSNGMTNDAAFPFNFPDNPIGGLVSSPSSHTFPYEVSILGIPENGARSRTETQIKLILRVLPRHDARSIKFLLLPSHQLSSAKRSGQMEYSTLSSSTSPSSIALAADSKFLYVRARIVRSDQDVPVYSCHACIIRERRRFLKKRAKSSSSIAGCKNGVDKPVHNDEDYGDEHVDISTAEKETELDRERILIFANPCEKVPMMRGDVMLPIRLTCYCRHHDERIGFRVRLELLDSYHQLVGLAYSPPILITDDHKRANRQQPKVEQFVSTGKEMIIRAQSPELALFPLFTGGVSQVLKVVPAEGPMHGGVEITIVGEYFNNDTVVLFGQIPTTMINFVSSSTIIVRLPPSHIPGIVPVTVFGQDISTIRVEDLVLFNYKNDIDKAMMELALQLIGMKMTGRVDDARDIALRIISEFSPTNTQTNNITSHRVNGLSNDQHRPIDKAVDHLERVLITCLTATEVTGGLKFTEKDIHNFRTVGGQTLLHLAALARFDHLFEYLGGLGDGILLSNVDKNGFTPADLYYLSGRQDFLQALGLDDSDGEEDFSDMDLPSRYQLLQRRVVDRTCHQPTSSSLWSSISDSILRIKKKPSRIKNHFNRAKNYLWRKMTPEADVKEYYLKSFGSLAISAGARFYQDYQETKPINGRVRGLLIWYCWVPILVAAFIVWYFNLGANIATTMTSEIFVY